MRDVASWGAEGEKRLFLQQLRPRRRHLVLLDKTLLSRYKRKCWFVYRDAMKGRVEVLRCLREGILFLTALEGSRHESFEDHPRADIEAGRIRYRGAPHTAR